MIWWWTADFEPQLNETLSSSDGFGEGNGTPLQYSCLENPMDGGAWWAAVHGVAKSQARVWLHFHFSLSCIGEGNGNPLQCSCLEYPRDRGAAVYGDAQSRTRLKQLSSSSSSSGGLLAKLYPTLATPWTVACQAHLSMEFFRQEYWSGLPFFSPGHLLNPGIEPTCPALQMVCCIASRFFTDWFTREAHKWNAIPPQKNTFFSLVGLHYKNYTQWVLWLLYF